MNDSAGVLHAPLVRARALEDRLGRRRRQDVESHVVVVAREELKTCLRGGACRRRGRQVPKSAGYTRVCKATRRRADRDRLPRHVRDVSTSIYLGNVYVSRAKFES